VSTNFGPSNITRLGPFELDAVIGSGGFGTVYRATDASGRLVALKVLAPHADSEETLRRFKREGDIRIDHPNVVQVLDAGQDQGLFYIAFELLVGKPLIALLERAPLAPDAVVDLGLQICAGLSAAHERGLVHRDLKPGNVFVCEDGTLKVLDFGIARPMSQTGAGLTMAGSVIGTPGFLSPEQAKGDPTITAAADLWSLGVILYQAASGTNPFMRTTAVATILAVVLEEAPPIAKTHALPRGLADAIHRCLHKEPSERWPSAEALAIALSDIDVHGSVTQSVPPEMVPSIALDEQRVVALLLAADVHDLEALERAVKEWGGELTPMLGGALGVFGGRTYEGDESVRAVNAAIQAR
jgi:serine/threonine protein kinase